MTEPSVLRTLTWVAASSWRRGAPDDVVLAAALSLVYETAEERALREREEAGWVSEDVFSGFEGCAGGGL